MIINTRSKEEIESYKRLLGVIGSLSNLFAETTVPYINYRVSENLFCRTFSAKNLSRSDVSADASIEKTGIGIKTFIEGNSRSMQKIAEFNKDKSTYSNKEPKEIIQRISSLRNDRLDATKRIHGLDNLTYHCITRKEELILAYDATMDPIAIDRITNLKIVENVISFADGLNEYSFNLSKSTLYKRFITPEEKIIIPVKIISDPFDVLEKILLTSNTKIDVTTKEQEHIYLPLYSDKEGKVPERSQLNQWNAEGRKRDYDEVYIPIPAIVRDNYPKFFPPRDTPFEMLLPNGDIMSVKVCQDNSKALMSNPNKALGKWLLRDVLNLKQGELLTDEKLKRIGLDSVVIYKENSNKYSINFSKTGKFREFKKSIENNSGL